MSPFHVTNGFRRFADNQATPFSCMTRYIMDGLAEFRFKPVLLEQYLTGNFAGILPFTTEPRVLLLNMKMLHFDAVIFDMDGVVTKTAAVHSQAWKKMFDEYLRSREEKYQEPFREFTHAGDYLPFVDGRPRYKGVEAFLNSRGIHLPFGRPEDDPGGETVCGLGNRKNEYFNRVLRESGVEVFDSSITLIRELIAAGVKIGLATSSNNCGPVLRRAGIMNLFETRVDGFVSAQLELKGKPEPDIFLMACGNLGAVPARAAIVEDAITGVQAGSRGGFGLTVGVAREDNARELKAHGADLVVSDLSEISLQQIDRWFASKTVRR